MATKTEVEKKAPERLPVAGEEAGIAQMMEEARRKRFAAAVTKWRGKLHLDIDTDEIRGRNRS
jgi:hypothetical protein